MSRDARPLSEYVPEKRQTIVAQPQIASARISPDGRWLAGGGFDGTVRIWDLAPLAPPAESPEDPPPEPQPLAPLAGHGGWVEGLCFAGSTLLTADSWGRLIAWSLDGAPQRAPSVRWQHAEAHDGWIRQVSVAGSRLATCGRDRQLRTWSLATGQPLRTWQAPHDLYCVAWDTGSRLYTGDARGQVCRWSDNGAEPEQTYDASPLYKYDRIQDVGGVKALAIDERANLLAAAGATPSHGGTVQGEPTLLLFDLVTGELRNKITLGQEKDGYVHDLARHPAGFWMAVTCGTPGTGQLLLVADDDESPFYRDTKVANPHSLSYHAPTSRLAVATTNKGSNGNGRRLNAEGQYESNSTPVELFKL